MFVATGSSRQSDLSGENLKGDGEWEQVSLEEVEKGDWEISL